MAAPDLHGSTPTPSRHAWLPLVLGGALAWTSMHVLFVGQKTRFDELALGSENTVHVSTAEAPVIHCIGLGDVGEQCFKGAIERAMPAGTVLWLGNSQLHAINQYQPGDEAAGWWVHEALASEGRDLVTISLPNANLQEHYLVAEYARQRMPVRTLIVPAVFDDMRETGIRALAETPFADPAMYPVLQTTATGSRLLETWQADLHQGASNDPAEQETTLQERSEKLLDGWSGAHSSVWAARAEARGQIFDQLYLLRNTLLGINAQTIRPLIITHYQDNMQALRDIVSLQQRAGIRVIVYIAPLRNDITPPYVPAEYVRFQQEVQQLAAEAGVEFADLSNVVPGEYWGLKAATNLGDESEYDFMHFQARGHRLLAKAVLQLLDRQP